MAYICRIQKDRIMKLIITPAVSYSAIL